MAEEFLLPPPLILRLDLVKVICRLVIYAYFFACIRLVAARLRRFAAFGVESPSKLVPRIWSR